jgi:NCAIR mutase (PurE)-related protein
MSVPRNPFDDFRQALQRIEAPQNGFVVDSSRGVRADPGRWRRAGIPEVVFAESKPVEIIVEAMRRLAEEQGRVVASRVASDVVPLIREDLEKDFAVVSHTVARCLVAGVLGSRKPEGRGTVGVLAAGSSDIPIASEAALMASEMGAKVLEAWDVGVAGLHRLVEPLSLFAEAYVDAIVVAAGMDGALAAVVAGLVDVPVIGLPVSTGYGFAGGGIGALTTMLQSCAPGLAVVNIDNGIGAGATAALIANRAAASPGIVEVEAAGEHLDRAPR